MLKILLDKILAQFLYLYLLPSTQKFKVFDRSNKFSIETVKKKNNLQAARRRRFISSFYINKGEKRIK